MKRVLLLLAALTCLLSSCVVTQDMTAVTGYSGKSKTTVTVSPFFLSVLEDFSSFTAGDGFTIMDDAMISFADRVNGSPSSSSVSIVSDGEGKKYVISFDYSSLVSLMRDLNEGKGNSLLSVTSSSISFNLSLSNYPELKSVIPFLSDRNFEVYGPEYSNGMTEDEYMEMISFLLGEESPDELRKSSVTIRITVPGKITGVSGAVRSGEKSVVYTFPVISFLLLNEPLSFSVTWK